MNKKKYNRSNLAGFKLREIMNKYCLEVSNYTLLPEANDTLPERLAKTALFLKIDPYFSFYFFIITFSQLYCLIIFLFPLHCAHVTNPASILPPYIWKKHSARLKDKIKEKACNCILSCGKQFCKYYLYKQQTETQTKNDIFRFCLNVFFSIVLNLSSLLSKDLQRPDWLVSSEYIVFINCMQEFRPDL